MLIPVSAGLVVIPRPANGIRYSITGGPNRSNILVKLDDLVIISSLRVGSFTLVANAGKNHGEFGALALHSRLRCLSG